jgi:hypothetical protein
MINFTGQIEKFPKTIDFFNEKLKTIDTSQINHIHLSITKSYGGICHYPTKKQNFIKFYVIYVV